MEENNAQGAAPFWCDSTEALIKALRSTPTGLTSEEARLRMSSGEFKSPTPKGVNPTLALLVGQFKSPIILILLVAITLSFFLGDVVNATIILVIVW